MNDTRRIAVIFVKQSGEWKGVPLHSPYLKPINTYIT